ncbi:sigma 54-interacting transcriptional regulator [Edwardsiella ictaluri]|uniref:Sigma 54-interacting transcriptional regulator n=1 Tax=Edwardsiella ictaluri TaxID=67780 RepID=A0ABY8GDY1_EDWIC|nr:sigma 54-interacting transcriptional regulator [Edwardsiella ictaluri]ELV7527927.1 sigma 54-interacting transcriptional regulator [Edwardsiella ictaluri]KMQ79354.1 Fis family transcriptional regulator [Edwardsiella ictaluri]KOO55992.1 Fis family transcriptional regulator [Edwardsiella ictaluri]WFN95638.1 sigma 54-interacting transcriptional regulator [Edwardsiella ictaluri]
MPDTTTDHAFSSCKNATALSSLLTDSLLREWLAQMSAMGAGIAIMCPDLHLLHTVGIDFQPGAWLPETTAATAAARVVPGHPVAWLSPEEHHLACLRDWASYAWLHTPSQGGAYILCILLPAHLYSPVFLLMMHHFRRRLSPVRHTLSPDTPAIQDGLIGQSPAFLRARDIMLRVAGGNSSIMLNGESGTGKELFARAIHRHSPRAGHPFIAINCSAIPAGLISSELFGYRDGAFTGARRGGASGVFESAHGGTLLLDEVGELPLDAQAILLRVLEERTVVRLGDTRGIPIDVRIITATNRDLAQMVREHTFRQDLYYRLNVIPITLPPLRQRPQDIPLLAHFFLTSLGGSRMTAIEAEAMTRLCASQWPGNIRQLRNVIEWGINFADGNILRCADLPPDLDLPDTPPADGQADSYAAWERRQIWALMQRYRANKTRIAQVLGISRGTLYKKIRHYGL